MTDQSDRLRRLAELLDKRDAKAGGADLLRAAEAALCSLAGEPSPADHALHDLISALATLELSWQHDAQVGFISDVDEHGAARRMAKRELSGQHAEELRAVVMAAREKLAHG